MHFVYVLVCFNSQFYTGLTSNIKKRINEHEAGMVESTKHKLPIKIVWVGIFRNKFIAASFEKYLKSSSGKAFLNKHLI